MSMPASRVPIASRPRPIWLAFGALLTLLAGGGVLVGSRPPAALPPDAPAAEFSAGRALALTAGLLGDETAHPVGSAANATVGARVAVALAELGGPVEMQRTFTCQPRWAVCGEVTNIMTRLPGVTDGPAVLLTAHYDSVPAGPGVADDLSSVAAVIEIGRILSAAAPSRNPVILLASDGEEPGLLGAEAFMAEHPWAATVGMVVNLEAGGTGGPSLLLQTSNPNGWLLDIFAREVPRPVGNSFNDALFAFLPNNTDFTIYTSHGIAGVNLAFAEGSALYHTPRDSLTALNPDTLQHQGENALALTRALAAHDPAAAPSEDQVFIDLLPGWIVRWPAAISGWLGLGSFILLLGTAGWLWWRGEMRGAALGWGLLPLPAGLLLAGAAAYGWALAMIALDAGNLAWYAATGWMRVAVWLLAALLVLVPAGLVSRFAGIWGLALGTWLWLALVAAVTGWLAPGFSILFIPVAFVAAVLLPLAAVLSRRWPAAAPGAIALSAMSGGTVFMPLAVGSEDTGGGADLIAIIGVVIALTAVTLAPLAGGLAALPRGRWITTGAGGLVVIAASASLLISPAYSPARPQRLNLLHIEQPATGRAEWGLLSQMPPEAPGVPAALRERAAFVAPAASPPPWQPRQLLLAPAPASGAAPPGLAIGDDGWRDGARQTTVTLAAGRDAARLALYVPAAADLRQIAVAGRPAPMPAPPMEHGFHAFRCVGPACDGLTLTLTTVSTEPATLFLVAASRGLPAAAAELLAARPESAAPSHDGDQSLTIAEVTLSAVARD